MAFDSMDTFSVLSSAGRTGSWSMLSGLSLSQMSNIAILALPIYATDLDNREQYNFDPIVAEPAIDDEPASEQSLQESAPNTRRVFSNWRRKSSGNKLSKTKPELPEASSINFTVTGVALAVSCRYANVAISTQNEDGESVVYGYIPVVVAKCGVYLKEHGKIQSLLPCCLP